MRFERIQRGALLAAAIAVPALIGGARFARAAASVPPVDAATRRALVERIATLLEKDYVFPDTGAIYARALRADLGSNRYDRVTDPQQLADQLTRRLGEVHDDVHLRIQAPDPSSPLPPADVDLPRGPREVPESVDLDSVAPPMRDVLRARLAAQRRVNHYFRKLEILPGNVGYLKLDQVGILGFARPTADAALAFLANSDAVILDLRDNPGGAEGLNRYLVSAFFPADRPVHLYSRFTRPTGDTLATWSRTGPRATDLSDRPLFVLTSRGTGSAAENISFTLQGLHRATLVGETTGGGAHSSVQVGLPGGFRMVLPISRVFDPRTGRDWERVGVRPDVPCGADSALAVAHGLAIDSLIARAPDAARRGELDASRALYRAETRTASAPMLAAAAADYEGNWGLRRVWQEGGKLYIQRNDDPRAPRLELLPTGKDEFMVERARKPVRFERDASGKVVRMRLQTPTDVWEVVERPAP